MDGVEGKVGRRVRKGGDQNIMGWGVGKDGGHSYVVGGKKEEGWEVWIIWMYIKGS